MTLRVPDGTLAEETSLWRVDVASMTSMSAPEVRSFIGGLREGDCGLYVSTGGFTKEARYEAERAKVPVTLLDLDGLVASIVTHYDSFDAEGRALLPLVRVYWPVAAS